MPELIHTLPGLWMTRTMLDAARFASPHLDEPGDVVIVEASDHRYAVARMNPPKGRKAKILMVCLESDLPEVSEEQEEELEGM